MKKLMALWMVGMLVVGLAACGNSDGSEPAAAEAEEAATTVKKEETAKGGDEKVVIAGIYKAGDQVWFIDEGAAAEAKAKELGADEFIFIDAKMNPDTYLQAIENVIAQKVDGVITCIPDQQMSTVVVNKLTEAGIPVVAADDALQDENGEKLAPWVGISAYNIGLSIGDWMGNYAKDNGLADDPEAGVLFLTVDTVSSCVPRIEGEYENFKKINPDFDESRIFYADSDGSSDEAFAVTSGVLTAHPEIKKWIVMGVNDEGGVGATRALEQAGLDKEAVVAGLGGYLAVGEFEKDYSAMKCAAYFSAQQVGELSAMQLMDMIAGKEVEMEKAVEASMVTEDNYKEIMGQ